MSQDDEESRPTPPRSAEQPDAPRGSLSRFAGAPGTGDGDDPEEGEASVARVRVSDRGVLRPFMRGILVHSLTERGFAFEDAYRVSQAVWQRVRTRQQIDKIELREIVAELSAEMARTGPEAEGRAIAAGPRNSGSFATTGQAE